jgi:hypothetical protein
MMKLKFFSILTAVTLLMSACTTATPAAPTPDIAVARTSAAQTVVAEITLTAAAFTPTTAPLPTETLVPPSETPSTPLVIAVARTSAAQTVVAEITLTAAAFTPTTAPLPTETLVPPSETPSTPLVIATLPGGITATPILCDSMTFDPATVDVNTPDGTQLTVNQEFVKTWKIKNNGSCVWGAGYGLIFSYGEKMSGLPKPVAGVVAIGQEVEVSVSFKTPAKAGEYQSFWIMANASGIPFGKPIYVKILVK